MHRREKTDLTIMSNVAPRKGPKPVLGPVSGLLCCPISRSCLTSTGTPPISIRFASADQPQAQTQHICSLAPPAYNCVFQDFSKPVSFCASPAHSALAVPPPPAAAQSGPASLCNLGLSSVPAPAQLGCDLSGFPSDKAGLSTVQWFLCCPWGAEQPFSLFDTKIFPDCATTTCISMNAFP